MLARLVGVLLGLLLLSLVFGVIERLWPSIRGQRRFRRGLGTDLAWWFWLPTVNQALTFVTVAACAVVVAIALGHGGSANEIRAFLDRDTWVSRQPIWLQFVMLLVLMDLAGYWSHRLFHGQGILWRFHAVHHSSEEVDWLSSVRVHPVNEMGQRLMQAAPFLAFGFDAGLLGAYVPMFLTVWAIGIHANVSWGFGPLGQLVASPRFHRWHHTTELEGLDKNFAGLFPWLDRLFGTYYLPKDRVPMQFGIVGARVPTGLHRQLLWPFRRRRQALANVPAA